MDIDLQKPTDKSWCSKVEDRGVPGRSRWSWKARGLWTNPPRQELRDPQLNRRSQHRDVRWRQGWAGTLRMANFEWETGSPSRPRTTSSKKPSLLKPPQITSLSSQRDTPSAPRNSLQRWNSCTHWHWAAEDAYESADFGTDFARDLDPAPTEHEFGASEWNRGVNSTEEKRYSCMRPPACIFKFEAAVVTNKWSQKCKEGSCLHKWSLGCRSLGSKEVFLFSKRELSIDWLIGMVAKLHTSSCSSADCHPRNVRQRHKVVKQQNSKSISRDSMHHLQRHLWPLLSFLLQCFSFPSNYVTQSTVTWTCCQFYMHAIESPLTNDQLPEALGYWTEVGIYPAT